MELIHHFKIFSIPSLTSLVRLLTCGEQPCSGRKSHLELNNKLLPTHKAQHCFHHLYPEESWLRSRARKNRCVMLGKSVFPEPNDLKHV